MRTHQQIDARSLDLHRVIATKIRDNPALFERVLLTLQRWRTLVSSRTLSYMEAWESLAQQGGVESCLAMATEDSPQAAAMRQSSPFVGILTNQERFFFLKTWRHESTTA